MMPVNFVKDWTFIEVQQQSHHIRYVAYCICALTLKKGKVGPPCSIYSFPQTVLDFIRTLEPCDINGEIKENAFTVNISELGKNIIQATSHT
jgi:hypothetical protein